MSRVGVHQFMFSLNVICWMQVDCVKCLWCIGVGRIGLVVCLYICTKGYNTMLVVIHPDLSGLISFGGCSIWRPRPLREKFNFVVQTITK